MIFSCVQREDRIHNDYIWAKIGVALIEEKMTKNRLRWFGHIQKRPQEALVERIDCMIFSRWKGEEGDQKGQWRKSLREISG